MSPYRFQKEPPFFYEEEEDSSARNAVLIAIGAAAGFAAGVLMAERFGGFKGLTDRLKDSFGGGTEGDDEEDFDYEGLDEDEFDPDFDDEVEGSASLDGAEELEERVLEAFRNDPTLSERAIDIGALEDGIIELTGSVNSEEESHQAVAVATGTQPADIASAHDLSVGVGIGSRENREPREVAAAGIGGERSAQKQGRRAERVRIPGRPIWGQ